jgi:hypothetical protein
MVEISSRQAVEIPQDRSAKFSRKLAVDKNEVWSVRHHSQKPSGIFVGFKLKVYRTFIRKWNRSQWLIRPVVVGHPVTPQILFDVVFSLGNQPGVDEEKRDQKKETQEHVGKNMRIGLIPEMNVSLEPIWQEYIFISRFASRPATIVISIFLPTPPLKAN